MFRTPPAIRMPIAAAALACGLSLAGCTTPEQDARAAQRDQAALAEALEGRVAGAPMDCIESTQVDGPQIVGDSLIYRRTGTLYRSQVADTCGAVLRRDQLVIARLYGTRICRNDQFQLLDRGSSIPGPICRFGRFVPYERR